MKKSRILNHLQFITMATLVILVHIGLAQASVEKVCLKAPNLGAEANGILIGSKIIKFPATVELERDFKVKGAFSRRFELIQSKVEHDQLIHFPVLDMELSLETRDSSSQYSANQKLLTAYYVQNGQVLSVSGLGPELHISHFGTQTSDFQLAILRGDCSHWAKFWKEEARKQDHAEMRLLQDRSH